MLIKIVSREIPREETVAYPYSLLESPNATIQFSFVGSVSKELVKALTKNQVNLYPKDVRDESSLDEYEGIYEI